MVRGQGGTACLHVQRDQLAVCGAYPVREHLGGDDQVTGGDWSDANVGSFRRVAGLDRRAGPPGHSRPTPSGDGRLAVRHPAPVVDVLEQPMVRTPGLGSPLEGDVIATRLRDHA
jgi:hypothetical protein